MVTHDISFTVPEGGRLAIEVLWSGSAKGNLEIHCNPPDKHASKVTSPSTDPAESLSAGVMLMRAYSHPKEIISTCVLPHQKS